MASSSSQIHWKKNELPGINCVVYGDDSVVIMNIYSVKSLDGDKTQYAFPVCDTTLSSLESYNDDIWTEIEKSPNGLYLPNGDRFICGEGGMGNEGFVSRLSDNKLVWALFSTESNPFIKMVLDGLFVKVYSNNDICYKIKIDDPLTIAVL